MAARVAVVPMLLMLWALAPTARVAPFATSLPAEEFAARRAKVLDAIGDGVAVLQGAAEYPAFVRFRQNSQFYYLTGVEVPRALLLLDGRARAATLFLPPRDRTLEQSEGPVLVPGDEAARLTGIPRVLARGAFGDALASAAGAGRRLYVPHRPESLGAATPHTATAHAEATAADPWDGRPSRAAQFVMKLREAVPGAAVADLDPILDRLRVIKSPREIALVREATRLAGTAIEEIIRSARPGQREHELEAIADFFFKRGGAQGIGYFALAAAGRNAYYPHYHGGQAELQAGDLVLFDYAPDYRYYTSDVTRMFPASGRFTGGQRERYTVYLRLYQELMRSIRPGATPQRILADAADRMDRVVAGFRFSTRANQDAAESFVEGVRGGAHSRASLGHMVGMEVHDVQPRADVLLPGMIFTIEPALTIPGERVYIRLEDVILVTESGYENLSGFVPVEPDAIESLMAETGRFEDLAPARGTK